MKHLKFLLLIIPAVFFISCSGNNSAVATKNSDDSNSSGTNQPTGDAHFSCTIDGQAISGGAIDQMQFYNTASTGDGDKGKELFFI